MAVQFVYQMDLNLKSWGDFRLVDRFWKEQARSADDNRKFFEYLVHGVTEYLPSIDKKIESSLTNWRMERVEKVDLAIIRVAIFEYEFGLPEFKVDAPVVINEAVEIAKKFGSTHSASFVNGVLDGIIKKKSA